MAIFGNFKGTTNPTFRISKHGTKIHGTTTEPTVNVDDGDLWMDMIQSRIKTFHTYNEDTANEIYLKIINEYYYAFLKFQEVMEGKRKG